MLKTLVKKQLGEIFRSYFVNQKSGKSRTRGATIGLFVLFVLLMVGMLGGIFTFLSLQMIPLAVAGLDWMYFALLSLIALVLGLFGSVFNTYAGLYLAKDNDLLLSLPIPPRTIMNARLLGVYLMGLLYSAVVTVPMAVVYWIFAEMSAAAFVGGLLLIFLVSLLTLVLSALLGYVVARVSLKLKNKSFITVLIALVGIAAYYFFYFKASSLLQELLQNAESYGEAIRGAAYPIYLFGRVGCGDWLAMLLVTAVIVLVFALVWWLLSRSFLKIATSTGSQTRVVYKEKAVKQRKPRTALLCRELRHFFSNPGYMLNCGIGCVFIVAIGVFMLFAGGRVEGLLSRVLGGGGSLPVLLTGLLCFCSAMTLPAAPSVSLEGSTIWLLHSLPVSGAEVLRAKLRLQLIVAGVPALFAALCLVIALGPDPLTALMMLLTPLCFCFCNAAFSTAMSVWKANLSWTREIVPIKQGSAVLLSMLGAAVLGFAATAVGLVFPASVGFLVLLAIAVVCLLLGFLLLHWLKTRGAKRFDAL